MCYQHAELLSHLSSPLHFGEGFSLLSTLAWNSLDLMTVLLGQFSKDSDYRYQAQLTTLLFNWSGYVCVGGGEKEREREREYVCM